MTKPTIRDVIASNTAPRAEFAYIDDSGDPGRKSGFSATFGLGCTVVPVDHWTTRLDMLVELRRALKATYGLRMRDEVKGEWIAGVKKHFRDLGLGDGQLRDIYSRHMEVAPVVCSVAFGVVIMKSQIQKLDLDVEEWGWNFLLQRLRMRTRETGAPIIVVHDNGSRNAATRAQIRAFRRHAWVSGQQIEAPLLIEDPIPRDSQHSYFVQLADLAAFAATRRVMPSKGKRANLCPPDMWQRLGTARLTKVSGRGDGIVAWP